MAELRRRTIDVDGVTRTTFVFAPRMRRIYLTIGVCAIFLAITLSAVLDTSATTTTRVVFGLASLFMGTFLLLGLRQLRLRPHVALLREGIYTEATAMAPRLIRWDTIESIGVARVGLEHWLGVRIVEPDSRSAWSGALARAGRTLSGWDVAIALPVLEDGDALPSLIAHYLQEPDARRELG